MGVATMALIIYTGRSSHSDVEVVGAAGRFICEGCPQHPSMATKFGTDDPQVMLRHLQGHRDDGLRVPLRAFRALETQTLIRELRRDGWEPHTSGWPLLHRLGLVRREQTDWRRLDYGGEASWEEWIPVWCTDLERLTSAWLGSQGYKTAAIFERRDALVRIFAGNSQKRAALEAVYAAIPHPPYDLILSIAEAHVP
jgi:hypothetical protein